MAHSLPYLVRSLFVSLVLYQHLILLEQSGEHDTTAKYDRQEGVIHLANEMCIFYKYYHACRFDWLVLIRSVPSPPSRWFIVLFWPFLSPLSKIQRL